MGSNLCNEVGHVKEKNLVGAAEENQFISLRSSSPRWLVLSGNNSLHDSSPFNYISCSFQPEAALAHAVPMLTSRARTAFATASFSASRLWICSRSCLNSCHVEICGRRPREGREMATALEPELLAHLPRSPGGYTAVLNQRISQLTLQSLLLV